MNDYGKWLIFLVTLFLMFTFYNTFVFINTAALQGQCASLRGEWLEKSLKCTFTEIEKK